jgi:GTP-binding protein YchF
MSSRSEDPGPPAAFAIDRGVGDGERQPSMLKAGIVGLPNVGKSTLFNALTRSRKAEAANYPFCTIDPNVGVVTVPDGRLEILRGIAKTNVIIPAAIEFVDIAGLVAGASKGEGLGNQFLANIREVDAIVHVVRCFEDADVVHTMGSVDPVRDIEVVATELVLADLDAVQKRMEKAQKKAKSGDKEAIAEMALLERLAPHLNANKPANVLGVSEEEARLMKLFQLLSAKPVIYACNVAEGDLATAEENPFVKKVAAFVQAHHDAAYVPISARIESELVDLAPDEAKAFLKDLGVDDSGVSALIRATYALLGLHTYFTAGEKEVRAWTIKTGWKAPQAAGVIHTDFEKGFIKAEVVSYEDLARLGSVAAAREAGKYRLEGKDYVFQDGDVALFRFNT